LLSGTRAFAVVRDYCFKGELFLGGDGTPVVSEHCNTWLSITSPIDLEAMVLSIPFVATCDYGLASVKSDFKTFL